MIELRHEALVFTFPELHPEATLEIDFQRTLRIPDDGRTYPLPAGLGRFPLRQVDDYAAAAPPDWIRHGGVMLPMYQSEAMWINFDSERIDERQTSYPFAVKIAAGKINAVSGKKWRNEMRKRKRQDYVVIPEQPWLDGFCVEKGVIRQFVAMPLGSGYSAEEQITGEAEHGGLQLAVYPMKKEAFEKRFPVRPVVQDEREMAVCYAPAMPMSVQEDAMGLAPGGRMRQSIEEDPYEFDEWQTEPAARCFVHIANSLTWRAITSEEPPTTPCTARDYLRAGIPWFDWYDDDSVALAGAKSLKDLASVAEMTAKKGDAPLHDNASLTPQRVIELRRNLEANQVREGDF